MASLSLFEVSRLAEPDKNEPFTLERLSVDESLHQQITSDFTRAGLTVMNIERLYNYNVWLRYNDKKKQILERIPQDPGFMLNETYLYHGTPAKKENLCEEGLDVNLATEGCFGRGIYFSDTPKKCMKYAKNKVILIARVMLGEIKEYEDGKRDKLLVKEPEKPEPYQGWRYYDSVKGRPRNEMEYVIYRNENALVEYFVEFSINDNPQAQPTDTATTTMKENDTAATPVQDTSVKTPDSAETTEDLDHDSSSDSDVDSVSGSSTSSEGDYKTLDGSSSSSDDECKTLDENDDGSEKPIPKPEDVEVEAFKNQSVVPFFTLPEGELSLEQKKAEFKKITEEENDGEVDSMLEKTDEDLERAIYLYFAYKQVRANQARREQGDFVEDEPVEDDGSPIFPPMVPEYKSEAWNSLNDEDKNTKMEKMKVDFMSFTQLEEAFCTIANKYVTNAKYNLDTAVIDYYTSYF